MFFAINDQYARDFIRKTIKRGKAAALKRSFESKQCGEILNTIENCLKNDNEYSYVIDEYLK